MRLNLDPRARRLLRRLPHTSVYSALELILLSLVAMQCARLVWTLVTPLGPVGDWRVIQPVPASVAGSADVLGSFDPFFRLSGDAGPVVVTSLDLKLFGVREDRASGRGAAIIGTADGQQRSFAVGDEILPGVRLTGVGFDSVTIARNGGAEQLFLDQSPPAQVVAPQTTPPAGSLNFGAPPAPPPPPPIAAQSSALSEIQFQPRLDGGQVNGVTVQPQGSGAAFRAAGLQPGDVIVAVAGRRIQSADQARSIATEFRNAREIDVQVERGGRTLPLRVRLSQ